MNKLPVLKYSVDDPLLGITAVAITSDPAVEVLGHHYSRVKRAKAQYSLDKSLHRLTAPLVRVDFNILRAPNEQYPNGYYVRFDKKIAEVLAKSMFKLNTKFNIEHEDIFPKGIELVEVFTKDSKRGINPTGFEEIADGSIFATAHITNKALWKKIESGEWNGFSLETYFSVLVPFNQQSDKKDSVDGVINYIKTLK